MSSSTLAELRQDLASINRDIAVFTRDLSLEYEPMTRRLLLQIIHELNTQRMLCEQQIRRILQNQHSVPHFIQPPQPVFAHPVPLHAPGFAIAQPRIGFVPGPGLGSGRLVCMPMNPFAPQVFYG